MRGLRKQLKLAIADIKAKLKGEMYPFVIINSLIIAFDFLYAKLRYIYINSEIPFWYTRLWGSYQLAPKEFIFWLPVISSAAVVVSLVLAHLLQKQYMRYVGRVLFVFVTLCNVFISYQMVEIISKASVPFEPFVPPIYLTLPLPFLAAFLIVYFILPSFMEIAHRQNLVTNPLIHTHPAMLLNKPSARGGGLVYAVVFVLASLFFVGISAKFAGLYTGVILLGLLGLFDDYQNTNPKSGFKVLENPILRLILLFSIVSTLVASGVKIMYITNPLGGILVFKPEIVAMLFTLIWIVWLLNVLSWSNGIDGQYAGIIGIASIVIALLALRFIPVEPIHRQVAVMAAISAGAAMGFARYTWYPSKIMWGFGAVCAGFVLSALSILIQGKIVTSVLIIMVPFLDAVVTMARRLAQKKNPFLGDRGHLHHLLLERGWSVKKIALFYWLSSAVFGAVGLLTSEKYVFQTALLLGGVVAFFITLVNVQSIRGRRKLQQAE